jgi:hypothetical protein
MGGFAGLGKIQRNIVRVYLAGDQRVRERGRHAGVYEGHKKRKEGGTSGWRLVSARREHNLCLIRALCTDLRGPAEHPDLLSCDGGFSDYHLLPERS